MSVVTVQLGQCGNQVGSKLFHTLLEDATPSHSSSPLPSPYYDASVDRFFVARERKPLQARAVLVDMESKVVQHSVLEAKRSQLWEYDVSCVFSQRRGSGNNWANGYCRHGPAVAESILDMAQRQAERCDRLDTFLVLMSVAGGTGSGVGAYITECLREDFPHTAIVNQVVWPYQSGEVIVQDYNAVLTTAKLQETSDAVLMLQNDQLHRACSKLLLLKHISFSDINKIVCHSLAGILQPCSEFSLLAQEKLDSHLLYQQCTVSSLLSHLCPHSDYKLLSVKSIPTMPERSHAYSRYLWAGLLKHLRQMLITDAPIEEGMDWMVQPGVGSDPQSSSSPCSGPLLSDTPPLRHSTASSYSSFNQSLANLLVLRGNELSSADTSLFHDPKLYASWTPPTSRCAVWCSKHAFNRYEKSCTLISNSQSCVRPLDSVCRKAWNMFTARAYVHQYLQHGWREDDFLESFATVEQVLQDYRKLGS